MSRRFEEAVRLGVALLIAATLAGLIALLLQGRADAAERSVEGTLDALVDSTISPSEDRVETVEQILEHDRRDRFRGATRAVLGAALRAATRRSLGAVLEGARAVAQGFRKIRARSDAERGAFRILDAEMREGPPSERLAALHAKLLARARRERTRDRLEDVRAALELGDAAFARTRLERLREQEPGHPRTASLEAALAELEERQAQEREALIATASEPSAAEAALLQSLLEGDVEEVCAEVEPLDRSLACAAGLYNAGEREEALERLREASKREGPGRLLADRWLEDERLHPEREWTRLRRRERVRQGLSWLGGVELERGGLDLSLSGLRAWRSAVSPFNLALFAPLRVLRHREPDRGEIRSLAISYLDRYPAGPVAEEAREVLAQTAQSAQERRRLALYRDGVLVLPRARTPYVPLRARPVLASTALLGDCAGEGPRVASRFGDAQGVVLLSPEEAAAEEGDTLIIPQAQALPLIDELASLLDEGRTLPVGGSVDHAAEALRLLDRVAREEGGLAVRGWDPVSSGGALGFAMAALEGNQGRLGEVVVRTGGDTVALQRSLPSSILACPSGLVCLDRVRPVASELYGRVEADGDPRIGVVARARGASLRLEISGVGPRAELDLPVARVFGVERWFPFRASVELAVDGLRVSPTLEPR